MKTVQYLVSAPSSFTQILDFGRYTVRVDPAAGRGWFQSDIQVGSFAGTLHFDGLALISCSTEMPPQVRSTLQRAGYDL